MGMSVSEKLDRQPERQATNWFLYLPQEVILLIILLVELGLLALLHDRFLTADNLLNQLRFLTEILLVALPMTYIIVTGGIDLSVGSIFGLSAIVLGYT